MSPEEQKQLHEKLDSVIEGIGSSITAEAFISLVDDLVSVGADPDGHTVVRRWLRKRVNLRK
jgi:hypothetical protein